MNENKNKNTIYFDIESQNTFEELKIFSNKDKDPKKLRLAIAGILYEENTIEKHKFFGESQTDQLLEILNQADIIYGHNLFRFDYPLLEQYTKENLRNKFYNKTFDTMLELQRYTDGCWTSLDDLAQRNLGTCKPISGAKIPEMWRNGLYKEVEEYLLNDLKMTKGIYEYIKKNGKVKYLHKEYGRIIGEREVMVKW